MDHRFHHPPEMMILFIDRWTRAGDIIVSSRHRSPRRPSRPLASPASRKNNTRTAHICIRKGEARDRWKRDGSKAPPSRVQEAARTWGEERGGAGKEREGRMPGLHSAFRERDTFYRGAPSLRQFAAHTKRGSLVKLENSWFVLRWEKVYVKAGEEALYFLFLFGKFFEFFFFFWFLGEKSCIISNYSD